MNRQRTTARLLLPVNSAPPKLRVLPMQPYRRPRETISRSSASPFPAPKRARRWENC